MNLFMNRFFKNQSDLSDFFPLFYLSYLWYMWQKLQAALIFFDWGEYFKVVADYLPFC